MTGKQTLGWIGASVAAGVFPTFSMSFAGETLAGDVEPGGNVVGERQAAGNVPTALPNVPTHSNSVLRPSAG